MNNTRTEMKKWSSQLMQFMQLRREAWKKFRTSMGFEPVTSRLPVRCSTNWAMKPLTLEQVNCGFICSRERNELLMIYEMNHTWTVAMKWKEEMIIAVNTIYAISFHFISTVHIWFISYIINTHFFHVLNFFQTSLRNCINCINCDDHFFISFHFLSSHMIHFIYH